MFVVGGSYKGFYINELNKIKNIDLLIFHQNIFYDFDYEQEYLENALVSNELITLNKKLNCPIIVYGCYKLLNKRNKCFILCVNQKVSIIEDYKDVYLYIKGKCVLVGNKIYFNSKADACISIINKQLNSRIFGKNFPNNYFICDTKGVTKIKDGKICRKFRKCCYFSLSFYKNMI